MECHYCGAEIEDVLAGAWGALVVSVRRHVNRTLDFCGHHPRTSEEVWAEEEFTDEYA